MLSTIILMKQLPLPDEVTNIIIIKYKYDALQKKYNKYISRVIVHKDGTTSFLLKKNPNI